MYSYNISLRLFIKEFKNFIINEKNKKRLYILNSKFI